MKKKNMMAVALLLAVAMFMGVATNSVVKSKAEEMTETQMDDINEGEAVKEFIKKFRKDNVIVTITSLDDLYDEFDNYENIDENVRENILAKTSDEVIMQFLLEEQKTFYSINQEVEDVSAFSEKIEDNAKKSDVDFVKDIETECFKKGEDSYKKVTIIKNKYGNNYKITTIDEAEDIYGERGYGKFTKDLEYTIGPQFKEYGNRKFSYEVEDSYISRLKVVFKYTLEYGCIKVRKIESDTTNIAGMVYTIKEKEKNIEKSQVVTNGESVKGYILFQGTLAKDVFGGFDVIQYKVNMSVKKGADSNNTTKCGMMIEEKAVVYTRTL